MSAGERCKSPLMEPEQNHATAVDYRGIWARQKYTTKTAMWILNRFNCSLKAANLFPLWWNICCKAYIVWCKRRSCLSRVL